MKLLMCLSLLAACVSAGAAEEAARTSASEDRLSEIVLRLVEVARSTSYSSLLTLNVTNIIILAFVAFIALGYFGFIDVGLGLGRSFGGGYDLDYSSIGKSMSSVASLVHQALETYANLQEARHES
ncbi:uncharacterized protein LOC122249944 [Penaeus japonicus]|uniref:uncharacterized protein LOC122249944 n=1 Tax=Penaeus japonicus TaxID=27405 RepID=UPI001C7178E3|nr:uncharacterized protein LOC122249944 [Penaeus japonicus]